MDLSGLMESLYTIRVFELQMKMFDTMLNSYNNQCRNSLQEEELLKRIEKLEEENRYLQNLQTRLIGYDGNDED